MKHTRHLLFVTLLMILALLAGCGQQAPPPRIATIEDMAEKRIGVVSGFIYDKFASERFPAAQISRFNSQTDLLLAIKSEKVDVAITNYAAAKNMLKDNAEVGILTDQILTFPIGIGFNKNNPELRARFDAFLQARKADGSLETMYRKWFDNDLDTIKMPKFKANPSGRKVVLGVAIGDLPSAGYVDGEYVGFDLDLAAEVCARRGWTLVKKPIDWDSKDLELETGAIDCIWNGFTMKSRAPAWIASITIACWPMALHITILAFGSTFLISFTALMPSISGIVMSIVVISGFSS